MMAIGSKVRDMLHLIRSGGPTLCNVAGMCSKVSTRVFSACRRER
jgi:hypothetical protein